MPNDFFRFKKFIIRQERNVFRVGTDGVILGAYADVSNARHILDIGSGTGLIALMLAQRCNAGIYALEPDSGSFRQLTENIESSPWKSRINPVNKRLQDYYPDLKFDIVVSNPPYFINSIRNPDPAKAKARHSDILSQIDLIEGISRLLNENGRFQIIMPVPEGKAFIVKAEGKGFYCNDILHIKPSPAADVKRLIMTFSTMERDLSEKTLVIEDGVRRSFTEEYIELTKDFYLKF
ncbi:MAG TPA: methyltransferase [Bacteroidales bacterium]|nr:methyltransferase [Bacteroidales bacterium]